MKNLLWLALGAMALCGCSTVEKTAEEAIPPVVVTKITEKIKLDGKFDEKAWAKAPAYNLEFANDAVGWPSAEFNRIVQDKYEGAKVRFLYDDKYL